MKVTTHEACELLSKGEIVAIPTETVYGLAASLSFFEAIERIFTLKGRPTENPLIIHIRDKSQVYFYTTKVPEGFEALAESLWPGPLTLVIPIDETLVPSNVRAGLKTAAFRVPSHPATLEVLAKVGPLVMPSANISGRPSGTRRDHVESDFGPGFPVLDGGSSKNGLESTILFHKEGKWEIVRLGALSAETFIPVLGYRPKVAERTDEDSIVCPGQAFRHYAPKTRLVLKEAIPENLIGSTIIGFSGRTYPTGCRVLELGPLDSPEKIAENLYAILRDLDIHEVEEAFVDMDFPKEGLYETIRERLKKASSH